jgi:hypothetical protein
MESNLKRYVGKVRYPSGRLSMEYVDWFVDDEAAKAGYRLMLEAQGYSVSEVRIENGTATVDIY